MRGGTYRPLLQILDRAGFDPDAWSKACDELAWLLRSRGTIVAPFSPNQQTLDVPSSTGMQNVLERFHREGWIKRDPRVKAFPLLMKGKAVTDHDLFEACDMEKLEFYSDWLSGLDLKWFAAAGFPVDDTFWAFTVHRGRTDEPFSDKDLATLRDVMGPFQLAARRTRALGLKRADQLDEFLSTAGRGVMVVGWTGRLLRVSQLAEALLARHNLIRQGRLVSSEPKVQRHIDLLVACGLAHGRDAHAPLPSPLVFRVEGGMGLSIDVVPMPRDFGSLLSGAASLLTVHEVIIPSIKFDPRLRYGLTNRETELASRLAAGHPLARIAGEMGISVETARQYIKSIFAKTGTNRQTELVVLWSQGQQ